MVFNWNFVQDLKWTLNERCCPVLISIYLAGIRLAHLYYKARNGYAWERRRSKDFNLKVHFDVQPEMSKETWLWTSKNGLWFSQAVSSCLASSLVMKIIETTHDLKEPRPRKKLIYFDVLAKLWSVLLLENSTSFRCVFILVIITKTSSKHVASENVWNGACSSFTAKIKQSTKVLKQLQIKSDHEKSATVLGYWIFSEVGICHFNAETNHHLFLSRFCAS